MIEQIHSLPELIRESVPEFDERVRGALDHQFCLSLKRLYVTGCGDSHHASLTAELAFEAIAGIPTEPMTALQFAHYAAGYLPDTGPGTNAVVGISVSGEVSRTLEALNFARQAGAVSVTLTATPGSRIAEAGDLQVYSMISSFPDPPGTHTPGVRTYAATQLALFLMAVRIGEVRGHLTTSEAATLRDQLLGLAEAAERTIESCDQASLKLGKSLADANEFVFAGGGPNFGTALFSAAKVLEASGDAALGQDLEEWAHLQYFTRHQATPTFFISTAKRDLPRAVEVTDAAKIIGRRVIAIVPGSDGKTVAQADFTLPLADAMPEVFSPLVVAIPGELFAAHRADLIGETFFRGFGGGRSVEGGGGASRIRTGAMLPEFPR
jgi:glucosamine--fructose-6-phosphate aminotransferase (isomerizing)